MGITGLIMWVIGLGVMSSVRKNGGHYRTFLSYECRSPPGPPSRVCNRLGILNVPEANQKALQSGSRKQEMLLGLMSRNTYSCS